MERPFEVNLLLFSSSLHDYSDTLAMGFDVEKEQKSAADYFYTATRHMTAGQSGDAMKGFRQAIALDPDMAEAYTNLAILLDEDGQRAEAEELYRKSLRLKPDIPNTHMNLGILLAAQKRFAQAEAAYRQSLALDPNCAYVWLNLGVLQICTRHEQAAEESLLTALKLDPQCHLAAFNLSYIYLRQGRYEEGWRYLEARDWYKRLEEQLPCPRWRGESLKGRTIMIGFEAGQGDMIQFARYASVLKDMGATCVVMVCHPPLKRLFAGVQAVDEVYALDEPCDPSAWDYWTPPLSMPFYCHTRMESIPADIPYINVDAQLCERFSQYIATLCAPDELRVGLVWKGNTGFENDDQRSLPDLKILGPLIHVPRIRFFSLQKGAGEDEVSKQDSASPIVDLAPKINDFADTASIVANLDLVISVDTAVAHLAGALGKACWVMLPYYKTDWRWLKDRRDSPWYPECMRLFRQPGIGQWAVLIEEVRLALQKFRLV